MAERLARIDFSRRHSLPAWGLSAIWHALVILALGFLLRPVAVLRECPSRSVGIVLRAPRPEEDAPEVPAAPAEAASPARAEKISSGPPAEPGVAEGLLPDHDAAADIVSQAIQLPGMQMPTPSDESLVPALDVGQGGGRPMLPAGDEQWILDEEAASQAAKRALPAPVEIAPFGAPPARGRSFVFAIDRSGSMSHGGPNVLAAARSELATILAELEEAHRFQVVAYHHQCVWLGTPRLLPASDENRAAVGPFLDNLAAVGGTGHEAALTFALSMEPDVIFLLTDGGDPHLNQIQLANIRKLAGGRTSIHAIQFGFHGPDEGQYFLQQLARQNGGSYSYVDMTARRHP